jgi:hypothetical protein
MLRAAWIIAEMLSRIAIYLAVIGLSLAARRVDRRRIGVRPAK